MTKPTKWQGYRGWMLSRVGSGDIGHQVIWTYVCKQWKLDETAPYESSHQNFSVCLVNLFSIPIFEI